MQHKTNATRRSLLALGAGAALLSPAIARGQEANWPNRPVRIIAAFPAGSGTDSLARFYGERLARVFGQNFLIENIGGANGALGARAAARAAPDGYTILFGSVSTHAANPNLMREPGYDALRDFAPLSMISINPLGVLVRADNPARDLQAFIAHARANPGALNYGIGNAGGLGGTHLLSQAAGFKAEQIALGIKLQIGTFRAFLHAADVAGVIDQRPRIQVRKCGRCFKIEHTYNNHVLNLCSVLSNEKI